MKEIIPTLFPQPTSYLCGRGGCFLTYSSWFSFSVYYYLISFIIYVLHRAGRDEIAEFVEHDLDNKDDDWLQEFNKDEKILAPEKQLFLLTMRLFLILW